MSKVKNKTTETEIPVVGFLESIDNENQKLESQQVYDWMCEITKEPAKMWGASIVGFGSYHYKYESGREGDFFKVGFSPRKTALTLYMIAGFERYDDLMSKLGKYKTGKSCLYIKKLADVDAEILKELIRGSYEYMTEKYG